jgi:hypothetical protein
MIDGMMLDKAITFIPVIVVMMMRPLSPMGMSRGGRHCAIMVYPRMMMMGRKVVGKYKDTCKD